MSNELERLNAVLNEAISKMENDKANVTNPIEYLKLDAQINAFREIINWSNTRQQQIAQEQEAIRKAEKESSKKA